jgi:hypothetical protein
MRYKFFNKGNTIICVSSFAQKPVKAYAKCHPDDSGHFDEEYGRQLALDRCDYKVAVKRSKSAIKRLDAAMKAFEAAKNELEAAKEYLNLAHSEYEECSARLKKTESEAK